MKYLVSILILLCSVQVQAEQHVTVVMRDGSVVRGDMLGIDNGDLTLQMGNGKSEDLDLSQVKKVFAADGKVIYRHKKKDKNNGEQVPERPAHSAVLSQVKVYSDTSGSLYFDGTLVGTIQAHDRVPAILAGVIPGKHTLKLKTAVGRYLVHEMKVKEGYNKIIHIISEIPGTTGNIPRRTQVVGATNASAPAASVTSPRSIEAKIDIFNDAPGDLELDGKMIGEIAADISIPYTITNVLPGRHLLNFDADSGEGYSEAFSLIPGQKKVFGFGVKVPKDFDASYVPNTDSVSSSDRNQNTRGPEAAVSNFNWPLAFIPGVTEWRDGDYGKAIVWEVGLAASLGATDFFSMAGDKSYSMYESASSVSTASNYHQQIVNEDELYTSFAYVSFGFYALSVVDAFFFHRDPGSQIESSSYIPQLSLAEAHYKIEEFVLGWKI